MKLKRLMAGILALGMGLGLVAQAQANDEVLVWTDSARQAGFQMYQKLNPNVKMKIEVVDMGQFVTRVQLFNKAGSGWPDVVFTGGPDQVATLAQADVAYTADLTPLVSRDVISKFAPGSLNGCRIGGKLYCLRNDLAQVVLWYNAKLMQDFGYTVPKTWEEYEALGVRVAKEHPGYVIGSVGESAMAEIYFYAAGCPMDQKVGNLADTVRINFSDARCTRAARMLDTLVANGSISKAGVFEADFVKLGTENKILMLPAASWFGEFVFKPTYKTPAGQLSAALPPRWSSQRTAVTYGWGGGAYFVSSHAKGAKAKAAADIAVWMATSPEFQTDAPTFPAFLPAADLWAKKITADKYYANDIYPVFRESAGMISNNFTRYSVRQNFIDIFIPAAKEGRSIVSILTALQDGLLQKARTAGYTVSTR